MKDPLLLYINNGINTPEEIIKYVKVYKFGLLLILKNKQTITRKTWLYISSR